MLLSTFHCPVSDNEMHITRLDVAYDNHTGILDIGRIARDTIDQEYISKSDWYAANFTSEGISVYIGSPKRGISGMCG